MEKSVRTEDKIYCLSALSNLIRDSRISCYNIKDIDFIYNELNKISGVKESIILQKCNCTELYVYGNASLIDSVMGVWKKSSLYPENFSSEDIQCYIGDKCIEHMLKTASGLKSVILGDNQVLGQVRNAYKRSFDNKSSGLIFKTLFSYTRKASGEVKKITGIGMGNTSVARSAVDLLYSKNKINSTSILIMGAGETGALIAKSLHEKGYKNITISNRTLEKAEDLVRRGYAQQSTSLDEAYKNMRKFDVIFFAMAVVVPQNRARSINLKEKALVFDLGNPQNTIFFKNNEGFYNIDTIHIMANSILEERINKLKKANEIIKNYVPIINKEIKKQLVNIDINKNFHYLDCHINGETVDKMRLKSFFLFNIREFLHKKEFIEVQTPCVVAVSSDPVRDKPEEELFRVNWYSKKMYLRQSNQLHKQMLVLSGFKKIFEVGPFWREEIKPTPRHLSEAWGLDVEMEGKFSVDRLISFVGELLNSSTQSLYKRDLIKKEDIIDKNIMKISYKEACELLKKEKIKYEMGIDFGYDIEYKLYNIIKNKYKKDIFAITRYPSSIKKFYTRKNGNYTETFDIIYRGWEICSGAIRQYDYDKLVEGMKKSGIDTRGYAFYLDKFKNGKPHCGFCIGTDRVITKIAHENDVREFVLYPRSESQVIP